MYYCIYPKLFHQQLMVASVRRTQFEQRYIKMTDYSLTEINLAVHT